LHGYISSQSNSWMEGQVSIGQPIKIAKTCDFDWLILISKFNIAFSNNQLKIYCMRLVSE